MWQVCGLCSAYHLTVLTALTRLKHQSLGSYTVQCRLLSSSQVYLDSSLSPYLCSPFSVKLLWKYNCLCVRAPPTVARVSSSRPLSEEPAPSESVNGIAVAGILHRTLSVKGSSHFFLVTHDFGSQIQSELVCSSRVFTAMVSEFCNWIPYCWKFLSVNSVVNWGFRSTQECPWSHRGKRCELGSVRGRKLELSPCLWPVHGRPMYLMEKAFNSKERCWTVLSALAFFLRWWGRRKNFPLRIWPRFS